MPASPKSRIEDENNSSRPLPAAVKLLATNSVQHKLINTSNLTTTNHFKTYHAIADTQQQQQTICANDNNKDTNNSLSTSSKTSCNTSTTFLMQGASYVLNNSAASSAPHNFVWKASPAAVGGKATATQVQYIVPSITADGKLVLQTPAGGQPMRVLTSAGGGDISTAGGVIKPLSVFSSKQPTNLVVLNHPSTPTPTSQVLQQQQQHILKHGRLKQHPHGKLFFFEGLYLKKNI